MTTEQEAAPDLVLPEREIDFTWTHEGAERTRKLWVKMPKPEQILVWQRVITRLTEAPADTSWTGSELMVALERLRKIIDSLLVNKADVAWIDDQFLEGTLDFRTLSPMVTQAIAAFQPDNREGRRAAAKPAKKAARKKATTK